MTKHKANQSALKATIPIFFAVDDNYVPFLCVALRSICDNRSQKYEYQINVLIESLSDGHRKAIKFFECENVKINFIDVRKKLTAICQRLHIRDYYSNATYYRFFIPELFPEHDRGLYLDCDIVVNCDISKLYNCQLGDNLVGAVTEEVMTDIDVFGRYSEIVLKIPRNEYFNAGILVMNLKKMREIKIEQLFSEMLNHRTYRVAQDQDYLNVICKDKVFYINKKWNKTPMPNSNEAITPYIVHYKINFKPWKYDDIPYSSCFWKYADMTEFGETLHQIKKNYSNADKARDSAQYEGLVSLAAEEILRESSSFYPQYDNFCTEVI